MNVSSTPVVATMTSLLPLPGGASHVVESDVIRTGPLTPFPTDDTINGATRAIYAARDLARASTSHQAHGVFENDAGLAIAPLGLSEDSRITPLAFDHPGGPNFGPRLTFAQRDPELVAVVGASTLVDLPSGETGRVDDLGLLS